MHASSTVAQGEHNDICHSVHNNEAAILAMHTLLITHRSRSGLLASEGTRQTSSSTPSASYHCWCSRCDRPPALPRIAPSSSGLRASANTASYARRPSTSGGTVLARPPCRQQCPSVSWSRRWSHSRPRGREKAQSHRPGRAYGALRGDPTRPSRRHELPGPCATLHCCLTHCSSHSELWSRPVLFPHSLDRYPCSRPLPCTRSYGFPYRPRIERNAYQRL